MPETETQGHYAKGVENFKRLDNDDSNIFYTNNSDDTGKWQRGIGGSGPHDNDELPWDEVKKDEEVENPGEKLRKLIEDLEPDEGIDTQTDLDKMQKMRRGELLDNDEGELDEDEVDNGDSDNGRMTCPHCNSDFNPSNDGVVEGDDGTLYCSIGCLNQDI